MAQVHAFDYLEKPTRPPDDGLCVLFGEDRYLKWMVYQAIEQTYGQEGDGAFIKRWWGDAHSFPIWSEVMGDLAAPSLFGPSVRVGMVDGADKFVSEYRKRLESFQEAPTGALILMVVTWPRTSKLAQGMAKRGLAIECNLPQVRRGKKSVPDKPRVAAWLIQRAKSHHGFTLTKAAAGVMIDCQPSELGILDQNLAKLALFVEAGGKVDEKLVEQVVVGWTERTVFDLVDACMDGDAGQAMVQLDRLLQSGGEPVALFAGLAWSVRRYAVVAQMVLQGEAEGRRTNLEGLIKAAGFWGGYNRIEQQLKRLGRRRALELPQRLLELDLALKGSHSAPGRARQAIEQFLFWAAAPATSV